MAKLTQIIFACLFLVLISCNNSTPPKQQFSAEKAIAKASRYEKDGWIFVHLEGNPDETGFQNGYLLASEIVNLRDAIKMMDVYKTKKEWSFLRDESFRIYWSKIPEEYKNELDGIVKGVTAKLGEGKIDRKDILYMNANLEFPDYYLPWLEGQKNPTPEGRCSAVAATGSWTKDGKIVLAHNDWTNYIFGERWNIIVDLKPEKGNRIIMDAPPGFIHSGDDFFINSAGLVVTETTITQFFGYDTTMVPEFVRARKAIQYASSIDEWVNTMKENNNGGYANDWLIGDNKTGEIARLELGLKNQILERTKDGYFTGSNFPVHSKLTREETTFDTTLQSSSPNARHLRWNELMKEYKGKIDIDAAKKFMGDHHDAFNNTDKASARTLCGHIENDPDGAPCWGEGPYYPIGAVQGKATDGTLAGEMKLWAIMGHPCGEAFIASDFLARHPEFNYMKDYLHDMPSQVWSEFGKK